MSDACAVGSEGDRAISLLEIQSIRDEEYPVDSNQRPAQRGTWILEVSDMNVDLVAEKGFGPLRGADKNGRACPRINEALNYPGADVSR